MTHDEAQKQIDYWMRKLDLYEFAEVVDAAQTNRHLKTALLHLGYKVPRGFSYKRDKRTKYLVAADDWYPCYRDNKVAVSFVNSRIAVWGNDDFGMERDGATEEEYLKVLASEPITFEKLKSMGFERA